MSSECQSVPMLSCTSQPTVSRMGRHREYYCLIARPPYNPTHAAYLKIVRNIMGMYLVQGA